MKKILLTLGLLFFAQVVKADAPSDFNYIPFSSYTDVATNGPMLFSSAAVQIVGITIASPTAFVSESYVAFYRSTSPAFMAHEASTQILVATNYVGNSIYIPLFETINSSYTYMSKLGNAKVIFWLRYPKQLKGRSGTYPGLPASGGRRDKIEYPQP